MKKPLKEYYRSYYNGEFFRDFRYIYDGLKLENNKTLCFDGITRYNDVFNAKKLNEKSDAEARALNFITQSKHMGHLGLLGGEISFFKSYDEYKYGDIYERWNDRQFFDLDIESEKVDIIKDAIKKSLAEYQKGKLSKKELSKDIRIQKSDFKDLIFNDDLL